MPLDSDEMRGTDKDGSLSHDYCIYCYQNGAFIHPDMNLDEMRNLVKEKMNEMEFNSDLIAMTVDSLPGLKRWSKENEMVPA